MPSLKNLNIEKGSTLNFPVIDDYSITSVKQWQVLLSIQSLIYAKKWRVTNQCARQKWEKNLSNVFISWLTLGKEKYQSLFSGLV